MSTPLGDEPAFPGKTISDKTNFSFSDYYPGLTKREWLAGTIAAGIAANHTILKIVAHRPEDLQDSLASLAVDAADALLRSLERSESPTHTKVSPERPDAS